LHPTEEGRKLAMDLAMPQSRRIARALAETSPRDRAVIERFLLDMMNPDSRAQIAAAPKERVSRTGQE
jgi:DNA-binding MarR family transcriptional regulator